MRVNLAPCMVCTKMQRVCLCEWISRVQESSWIDIMGVHHGVPYLVNLHDTGETGWISAAWISILQPVAYGGPGVYSNVVSAVGPQSSRTASAVLPQSSRSGSAVYYFCEVYPIPIQSSQLLPYVRITE